MYLKILFARCALIANFFLLSSTTALASSSSQITNDTSPAFAAFLVIILSISVFSTGISLWIAYKFYTWRTKIDVTGALVPEQWAQHISNLSDALKKFRDVLENQLHITNEQYQHFLNSQQAVAGEVDGMAKTLQVTQEMLLKFQQTIDVKDAEISRLKNGYDKQILRKNILAMVNLHAQTMAILGNDHENKSLKNIEFLMRDEIENCGVQIKDNLLGEDFAKLSDYVDVVGYTSNSESDLAKGQISEVISEVYLIETEDHIDVLRKAKIKYHVPQEESND